MDFAENGERPRNITGIVIVVLLHVLIIYALLTGLARKVVEVIQQPVIATIVPEVIPPKPPPPPKPKVEKTVEPKTKAPPPPYVPPPEVKVQVQPQKDVISAVTHDAPPSHDLPPPSNDQPVANAKPEEAHKTATPATAVSSTCVKPEYPRQSLQDEEQGTVTLAFLVSAQGRVIESRVDHSSGSHALDRAALSALSQCSFKPGTVDGKPQESWTKMQYVWRLE